ncbi:hypothetical protein [Rubellimicrobium aerolatum]|uniref:Right-handed parallel beta-helix repeat-containing protein n=1 Tax=Rubellimicrobium aerolatum TaxID=490979 RepID=A0ABW0S995_9RHOB|nr:hypothetical protein [Rubellimicrobium aerolatum]MBP1804844.1 hypothetical protein [Rubellimicrobium aerolatum]
MTLADLPLPTFTGADLSARVNAALAELRAARTLPSLAALLADATLAYGAGPRAVAAGDTIRVARQGLAYAVAPAGATDHHLATAGGVRLYVQRNARGNLPLLAFGADPTGTASAAAALQKAVVAAVSMGTSHATPGSGDLVEGYPAIEVAPGRYLIDAPIDLNLVEVRTLALVCDDRAIFFGAGTRANGFAVGTKVRRLICRGIWWQNFATALALSTSNQDSSLWTFERCGAQEVNLWLDTGTYDNSRSTTVSLLDCDFRYHVRQLLRCYADKLNIERCWLGIMTETTRLIHANSLISIRDSMFIPAGDGGTGRAYVYLTTDNGAGGTVLDSARGVVLSGNRVSNEGSNPPLVVCDYPRDLAAFSTAPAISIVDNHIVGYHPSPFEAGGEAGIVHLLQYPGLIRFAGNSIHALGNPDSRLVSRAPSLSAEPPLGFVIDMDDATYRAAQFLAGEVSSYRIASESLRGAIRNPDPWTFRGLLEDGFLDTGDTATAGRKKASFRLRTGRLDLTFSTPVSFLLQLQGTSSGYDGAGSSVYAVTVNGYIDGGGVKRNRVAWTKLHGGPFGALETVNADLVSAHWGTADTGATQAENAAELTLTFTWGNGLDHGLARIVPLSQRNPRYGDAPR